MWPRKTLDIGFRDLLRGLVYTILPGRPEEARASGSSHRFNCLSVRSGFDTLLRSLEFPAQSEILFSELTIPDMERIVHTNGLRAVGVGLDSNTWSLDTDLLEKSVTPKTRAIVVAHLFGRRDSLEEISKFAKRHNLLLIEDCAQSFRGPGDNGDSSAEVSMFSFGPIKTHTCLGGGVLHFRNPETASAFERLHQQLPRQPNRKFAKRLLKYALLNCFGNPLLYGMLYRALITLGCDPDLTISGLAKGFGRGDLSSKIRKRPSAALLRLIRSRMSNFTPSRPDQRAALGRELTSLLSPSIQAPADSQSDKDSYWVYPILSVHPESLKVELVKNGFDGTQRSSLVTIPSRVGQRTPGIEFLEQVVYLPLEYNMDHADIQRLAKIVNSHEQFWRHAEQSLSKPTEKSSTVADQSVSSIQIWN